MIAPRKTDYYELLGIHAAATPEDILSAYRKKAVELHPDRNKAADATERFREINEAYRVLSDPGQRERYDDERIKQRLAAWAVMQQADRRKPYQPAPPPPREAAPKKPSGKSKRKRMKNTTRRRRGRVSSWCAPRQG